jgi:hypothetical protein
MTRTVETMAAMRCHQYFQGKKIGCLQRLVTAADQLVLETAVTSLLPFQQRF